MNESFRAIFLSYASEDAAAAKRIASSLRGAGIDVWFDQDELRGGDAWDRRIRTQISECRLFLPIVSRASDERVEGYFCWVRGSSHQRKAPRTRLARHAPP